MSVRGHIQFVRQWSCGVPVSPPIRVGSPKVVAKALKLPAMVYGPAPMLVEFCFGSAPKTVGKGRKRPVAPPLEGFSLCYRDLLGVFSFVPGDPDRADLSQHRIRQSRYRCPFCNKIGHGVRECPLYTDSGNARSFLGRCAKCGRWVHKAVDC